MRAARRGCGHAEAGEPSTQEKPRMQRLDLARRSLATGQHDLDRSTHGLDLPYPRLQNLQIRTRIICNRQC